MYLRQQINTNYEHNGGGSLSFVASFFEHKIVRMEVSPYFTTGAHLVYDRVVS